MGRVIVGVDPHKKSVTIEAVDEHGTVLARGRFAPTRRATGCWSSMCASSGRTTGGPSRVPTG